MNKIDDLLRHACLEHLNIEPSVTLSDLKTHLEAGRPALLSALKSAGVEKLSDRQLLANTLGKAQRMGILHPGVETQRQVESTDSPSQQPESTSTGSLLSPIPDKQPLGVLRWVVDISKWFPTSEEWEFLLSIIPQEDSSKTMRFLRLEDRKRALASRLLQRRACADVTGLPYKEVSIKRTKGSKPFLESRPASLQSTLPNWNFNVSHEGNYVALAAEPCLLCGVDVAAPAQVRGRPGNGKGLDDLFSTMKSYLTESEWAYVRKCGPDERAKEGAFRCACWHQIVWYDVECDGMEALSILQEVLESEGGVHQGAGRWDRF